MARCNICGGPCSGKTLIKEKRYFVGEKPICNDCFERWASGDYSATDERAVKKIFKKTEEK